MPDPYIVGDSSPFMKRVLIPFWVIRIIIMLIEIAVYGVLIGAIAVISNDSDLRSDYNVRNGVGAAIAIIAVVMILVLICLILDIVCIVKRARRTLSPRFFLIVNVIQTTLWLIFFILSMISAKNDISVGIGIIIFFSFLGLLIYAAVVFHQFRKGKLGAGNYQPAHNPALTQQATLDYGNTAYGGNTSYGNAYAPEPVKPVHYGDVPVPHQQGYGNQQYSQQQYGQQQGYEMHNRAV
ncbi:hypothetical protein B0H66DRAFT_179701 [Apodospora peruviana]|uniref:Uncharacterized protein n=1 Tax=Apodospora peruviana TaxID=516989 RepID=A0AAE0M7D9_9PEZI|nr:hypothetical protein B0H66DRAFT_179701 [Apodospora peruviana]